MSDEAKKGEGWVIYPYRYKTEMGYPFFSAPSSS